MKFTDDLFNNMRVYGTVILILLTFIVFVGVKYVSRFAYSPPSVASIVLHISLGELFCICLPRGCDYFYICYIRRNFCSWARISLDEVGPFH